MRNKYTLPLGNAAPAISCFCLPGSVWQARTHAAEQRAAAEAAANPNTVAAALGRSATDAAGQAMLWHPEFPTGFRLFVCDLPLYCLTAILSEQLRQMNGGRWLDMHDYGYLADVLRDAIRDTAHPAEVLHLRRALAWVKKQGDAVIETRPETV